MSDTGGIYSPGVCVFRGSEASEYQFLEQPYYVNMIAVAAIPYPSLNDGKFDTLSESFTREKIKSILHLASYHS